MVFPSLDEVVRQLREITEDDTIRADSRLADLDIDSLDVMEWIFEIEGQAGVAIDESLYSKDSLASATISDFYERAQSAASS
jgi:acyl carrier protein